MQTKSSPDSEAVQGRRMTVPEIPAVLRAKKNWLVWRLVQKPDEPKPRKIPFYTSGAPRGQVQGSDDDIANLATFEQAVAAASAGRYTGIGFAPLPGCGIIALDFDHCVADRQVLDERVSSLCEGTYSEISPSGTGLRAFFLADDIASGKDNAHKSKRVGGVADAPRLDCLFDIEIFGDTGFVTVTGNATDDTLLWGLQNTVLPITPAVLELSNGRCAGTRRALVTVSGLDGDADLFELSSPKLGWTIEQAREILFECPASSSRAEWLNALMALHHEFDGSADALDLADEWSATGDSYAGRSDVEGRWYSFRRAGSDAITGRWLLAWRRENLTQQNEEALRSALEQIQGAVNSAPDMLTLQTKIMPDLSSLLLQFPVLEIEAYSIVAARAKVFGTPINKTEFKRLIKSERPPAAASASPLTEFGNTERMLNRFGENLMFVPDTAAWYVWTGIYWRPALGGRTEIMHFAKETIKRLPDEADQHPDAGEFYAFCSASQRAQMVSSMVTLAESDPRVCVPAAALDKHRHLLGVKNGVVDLRTGQLLPPDPALRITLTTACDYNPAAKCPLFDRVLRESMYGDEEMVNYVERTIGYALMGQPKEDIMFIPFGIGANGKSTVFGAVEAAFGDYARTAEASTFIADKPGSSAGGAREDLVRLRGARFIYVNEPDEHGVLREGLVKSMTGGDVITARGVFAKSSIQLVPTWTVFMPTNYKPIIRGSDEGIWRRMGMLPFERNFSEDPTIVKDETIKQRVREGGELEGVLALAVRAALQYQRVGLKPPAKVVAARSEYRAQQDLLAEWIDECCVVEQGSETPMCDLWDSWFNFASRRGELQYIRSSASLGRRLDQKFPARRNGSRRARSGIKLLNSEVFV